MSTSNDVTTPLPLLSYSERLPSSDNVWSSQGSANPPPKTKRQNVRPCSVGPVPTNGRAARPEPRRKANKPVISTNSATHSSRSSLCKTGTGARVKRSTNEISAELVEIAEEIKTAPKTLLRDQSGTLVAVNSTPLYPPTKTPNTVPASAITPSS